MNITGSTHLQSIKAGQSYSRFRELHFETSDRYEKSISKDKNLEKINKHIVMIEDGEFEELTSELEEGIAQYNNLPSQRANKSRRYDSLNDYIHRKQSRKNVNPHFHGLEFMMVSKLGDMESWNEIKALFEKNGVPEEIVLSRLNDAFESTADAFNDAYNDYGLGIMEIDTNLDEHGAPHFHAHVINFNIQDDNLLDTNISKVFQKKFKTKNSKEALSKFREDIDSVLISNSSHVLKCLAKGNGFTFEGLDLVRTNPSEVGIKHELYVFNKTVDSTRNELERREKNIKLQEKSLSDRESDLNSREYKLKDEKSRFETEKLKFKADVLDSCKSLLKREFLRLSDIEFGITSNPTDKRDKILKYMIANHKDICVQAHNAVIKDNPNMARTKSVIRNLDTESKAIRTKVGNNENKLLSREEINRKVQELYEKFNESDKSNENDDFDFLRR